MSTQPSPPVVEIQDVAPRDGLQPICEPIATATKIDLVEQLLGVGLRRIEIGSLVSPKAVPQMADTDALIGHFRTDDRGRFCVLVPNVKGLERALALGVTELAFVLSVSESHNRNNVKASVAESLQRLADIVALLMPREAYQLRVNISTAFDCPFEGTVDPDRVVECVVRVGELIPDAEIALCDTTGRAIPPKVAALFERCMALPAVGRARWAFHGHDTYGLGVANALYAFEAGVRVFDTAAGGLGGCPFAPGATGNTATEDLVFAFENAGIATGVDLAKLLTVADWACQLPGAMAGGRVRTLPRPRVVSASGVGLASV